MRDGPVEPDSRNKKRKDEVTIDSVEDLRKLLQEANLPQLPIWEVPSDNLEQTEEVMDYIFNIKAQKLVRHLKEVLTCILARDFEQAISKLERCIECIERGEE